MRKQYNADEWYVWEQNAAPMFLIMTLNPSFKNLREYLGSCLFNTLVVFETDTSDNYQAKWIFRLEEGRILGQKMTDMLLCPAYMVAFNSGLETAEQLLVNMAIEIQSDFKQYTLDNIPDIFDEFCKRYYDYYRLAAFTEPVQWYTEHLLSGYLNKNYNGEYSATEALKLLLVTENDSFTVDILRSMRECAKELDKVVNGNQDIMTYISKHNGCVDFALIIADYIFKQTKITDVAELIEEVAAHSKAYHWKNNNYYATQYISSKDVLIELLGSSHYEIGKAFEYYDDLLKTIADSKKRQLEQKAVVFAGLPSYYQNVVSIANNIGAALIDQRKKNVMTCNSSFDILLSIVAEATNTTVEQLHLLIPQELRYYIQNHKSYIERLEQRKDIFICLQTDFPLVDELIESIDVSSAHSILSWKVTAANDPYIAEGIAAEQVLDKLGSRLNLFKTSNTDIGKLQGITAFYDISKEFVEGIVRVVKNPKVEVLSKGEILVAPSTTPDYINSINNCVAIITDWGGQTSHAAIVARELKKPCIIGTNYASQILKTGQRVRVDFTRGIIEIIV